MFVYLLLCIQIFGLCITIIYILSPRIGASIGAFFFLVKESNRVDRFN
jgi:hypothetical protein